ncbi:MAG: Asd/ArgC dimerization domain-containing protein, partial [Dehalococcoidia bacterium]
SAAPIPRIIDALRAQAGVVVSEDPKTYVTPLQAAGNDLVYVSRVRVDPTVEHGIVFWCVSDNLRKGAATNAIQIAEEMISRGLVPGAK